MADSLLGYLVSQVELNWIVKSLCRNLGNRNASKIVCVFHKPSEDIVLDFWKINLSIKQYRIKLFYLRTYNSSDSFIDFIHNKFLKFPIYLWNKRNHNCFISWFFKSSWWNSWKLIDYWFLNYTSRVKILCFYTWKTPLSLAKWFSNQPFLIEFRILLFVTASGSYFITYNSEILAFTLKTPATYFSQILLIFSFNSPKFSLPRWFLKNNITHIFI